MTERDILIKKYLEQHSLVESNIISFNNFIERRMQQIVDEHVMNLQEGDIEIKLGKVRIERPNIFEADGSSKPIAPTEARLRNLTYAAPVYMELSVKQGGSFETHEVEIGRIPVIVKSKACNLHSLNKEELEKDYNDPLDPGGYFIINGNERVMVMTEDLAENQPFIERGKGKLMLRFFSKRGAYRIPVSITEANTGILEVSFSKFRNVPALLVIKALGMVKDAEIAQSIGKETDGLIVNLYEFVNIQNTEDALLSLGEKTSLQGTKKEVLDRMKQRLDAYFMPHIGITKEERIEKAITFCKYLKQFLIAKEIPGLRTDKDHYANKRVRLSGDLLADLFRVNLNILLRDIQYSLKKTTKRKKFYSIKTIAKSTLFSHRIESAIATGNWIGERTGVTQNIDRTNYLSMISQLQRVSSMLPGEQENFLARTLHPTHYGRFCPIETPEGTEIGLRKNLALLARVSTAIHLDEERMIHHFKSLGLETDAQEGHDVLFNGKFIGVVKDQTGFIREMRILRRKNELPGEMSIRLDKIFGIVVISTEVGRVMRPLVVVEQGKSMLTEEHKQFLQENKIRWDDLLKKGIIEYIDAAEEDNALVAFKEADVIQEHTHLELGDIAFLGLVTSIVPFANFGQHARLIRGSKTQKQSLGLYTSNYPIRLDTDASILHYPQKPLVRSFVYDTLSVYPAGQNVVVAIMTYGGYNIEDAVVLNKSSVQRGLARSTYFRPYTNVELNYAGGLSDEISVPSKDTSGYRTEASYKYLEDDGIVYPEAKLHDGDVVVGKTSPPKFLSEAREITIRNRKDSSTIIRQEDRGIVDAVFVTSDEQGNKIVHVRTRDERIPEPGDKFSTPYGQKGVVGHLADENDLPFTSCGIRPDILFNPHGIPSRMTVGYLIEMVAGKAGSLSGKIVDATPFSQINIEELEHVLKDYGFRYDGKETMYDGVTGKMMSAKIFIGNMYYLKLRYMVSNKIHARASGKVTLLTRQPVEGRAKGGALRLGEMEQQALVAHGASNLLKERYDSDKVVIHICTQCGAVAIKDSLRNKIFCPICNSVDIEPVEMSYAFKLLVEELQSLHLMTHMELKNKYE